MLNKISKCIFVRPTFVHILEKLQQVCSECTVYC